MSRVSFMLLVLYVIQSEGQFEGLIYEDTGWLRTPHIPENIRMGDVRVDEVAGTASDPCTQNGASGVCKIILQCPSALEGLRNRIMPKICAFAGDNPIVCCIDAAPAASTAATPITNPTITSTTTQKLPVATTNSPSKVPSTTEYTPDYGVYEEVEEAPQCAPISPEKTTPRTGQKAWDKCIEYQEQYVFPCAVSVALTGGRVRGNNCKHNANQLVINGIDATDAEFPHMALLGFGDETSIKYQCGGSVISENFILTAGHCTYASRLGAVTYALVGTLRRSEDYDRSNRYGVLRIHKSPLYAPPRRYHDIALLETDRRIKLNAFVVPACLDTGDQPVEEALATGWGALANGSNADVLQKVKLLKFDDLECTLAVPPSRVLKEGIDTRSQMCFGDKRESKDTCQGDSGGPLQIKSAKIYCMYVVVGVTSFGRKCGVVGEPGVYTRVRQYLPWIESIVWP